MRNNRDLYVFVYRAYLLKLTSDTDSSLARDVNLGDSAGILHGFVTQGAKKQPTRSNCSPISSTVAVNSITIFQKQQQCTSSPWLLTLTLRPER